jgi:hypothetical protein
LKLARSLDTPLVHRLLIADTGNPNKVHSE